MANTTSTEATIVSIVDEFSFMFTDIPPRLCLTNSSPWASNKKYYPSHPHRDFVVKVSEKLEAWDGCAYPLPSLFSEPSSPTRGSSMVDRSNPYNFYGPQTDESVTPTHTTFSSDDSNRSAASSSPATSNSEPGTPATSKFQTIDLEAPYIDRVPPPAYRETPENPYSTYPDSMYHSRPCYVPFGYAKLPHFRPPRFSQRLRMLIAERRKPMTLRLGPLDEPYRNEKQGRVITAPDSTQLSMSRSVLGVRWGNLDPKVVVFSSLALALLGIFIIALVVASLWK